MTKVNCWSSTRIAVAVLVAMATVGPAMSQTYDIVIANGRVMDPETQLDATMNVGIIGGRIEAISSDELSGKRVIDATGKIVAPGFIDLHSHSFELPGQRMQAMDGVTTALELESGVLPVAVWYDAQAAEGRVINYGTSASWTFARIAAMVPEKSTPEATAEWYLGAFSYTNWQNNVTSPEELASVLAQLEQGLNEGALAIGVNAGYVPGVGGKELVEVSKLAKSFNVPTSTHIRDWSNVDPQSSVEGLTMMIGLAATTGVKSIICHLNSSMLRDAQTGVEMLEKARALGIDITTEAYPYGGGSFPISSAILQLPTDQFQRRIGTDWTSVRLIAEGRQILDEADMRAEQKRDPGQLVVLQYLDEENPEDLSVIDQSITAPWISIASDAVPWNLPDGSFLRGDVWPLPENVVSNPRSAGTFAKFLGSYVRERELLSWMDAIAKVTLIPAQVLDGSVPSMKLKGRLQVGMDADITVFHPETIADMATVDKPAQASVGVSYLLVNGTVLVADGELDASVFPGQAIRRTVN